VWRGRIAPLNIIKLIYIKIVKQHAPKPLLRSINVPNFLLFNNKKIRGGRGRSEFTRDLLLCNSPPVPTDNRHPLYNPRHPQNPQHSAICGGLDPGTATRAFIPGEVHKHFIPLILIHATCILTTSILPLFRPSNNYPTSAYKVAISVF